MADVTFTTRFDDSEIERSMQKTADLIERTQRDFNELGQSGTKAFEEIDQAAKNSEDQVKEYGKQMEDAADKTKKASTEAGGFGQRIRNMLGNISIFGTNLNDVNDSLEKVSEGMRKSKGAADGAGQGMSGLAKFAGIARLGLLALAVAVGTVLIEALKRYQSNLDNLRVLQAQFKIGTDVALKGVGEFVRGLTGASKETKTWKDRLADAGKVLYFIAAPINAVTTALFKQNSELRTQINLEGQLERQRIGLERRKQEQEAFASLQKQEIERLNLIADNTSKSFKEREAAAKKRQALSEQIGKVEEKRLLTEIGLNARVSGSQQKQIEAAQQIVKLSKEGTLTTEALAKQIEKTGVSSAEAFKRAGEIFTTIGELGDAQESLLGIQSEAFNQAQAIRTEQAAAAEQAKAAAEQRLKALEEAQKRLKEILSLTADADSQLEGAGRAAAQEFANATDEIVRLQDEYTKLAALFNTGETAADIEKLFQPLKDLAAAKFDKASFAGGLESLPDEIQKLTKRATDVLTGEVGDIVKSDTLKPFNERLRDEGLKAGEGLAKATKDGVKKGLSGQALADINAQALQLAGSLGQAALDGLFDAEDARFELQIARQDALIGKLSEKVEATRAALNEEEKLQQEGYANNVAGLKKQLEAEEREKKLAEDRKIEIERKAAKQRALVAAAEQAVQLTLAAARLAADGASKGPIGLVVALGALGILFRIMAAARSQAAAEAAKSSQGFAEGTEYVQGPGTTTSDSIHVRLSKGERVVKASHNAKLGGRAMTNDELVQFALMGQRVYDDPLLAYALNLRGRSEQIEAAKFEVQIQAMERGFERAADKAAEKQIEYWKSRPIEYQDKEGNHVRQWVEGGAIHRQITERE